MVDVSSHFVVASADESDKSYDFAILVSVGALAIGFGHRALGTCSLCRHRSQQP